MAKRTGATPSGGKHGSREYVPEAGHLIWLSFCPQAGREQAGRRPALVLSPVTYNQRTRLCIACPITTHVKGYPFEVPVPPGLSIQGAVLSDHVRSADWVDRGAVFETLAPPELMSEVKAKLKALIGI
jgi:mRNA interferase MazF